MIEYIDINRLIPHPNNPKLFIREPVIVRLMAGMGDGFKECFAITVRPLGDDYQIIIGHHRALAAKAVGLGSIPCHVVDMSDEDAWMLLITSNSQGETLPLEIGKHALETVAAAPGQKGMGIRAYAERAGISEELLKHWMAAARVLVCFLKAKECSIRTLFDSNTLCIDDSLSLSEVPYSHSSRLDEVIEVIYKYGMDKYTFLDEIEKAPVEAWEALVLLLNETGINVGKIRSHVKLIKELMASIPNFMVPKADPFSYKKMLCEIVIRTPVEASKRISVFGQIKRLGETLGVVQAVVYTDSGEVELWDDLEYRVLTASAVEVDLLADFVAAINGLSILPNIDKVNTIYRDVKDSVCTDASLQPKLERILSDEELAAKEAQEAIDKLLLRKRLVAEKVINGDCVDVLKEWQGKKASLMLTDPPYGMAFQSNRRTASAQAEAIINDDDIESALFVFGNMLDAAMPHLADDAHLIVFCTGAYLADFRALMISKGCKYKDLLTWVKPNHGTGDLYGTFAPQSEHMLHFVIGRPEVSPRRSNVFIQKFSESVTNHPTEKPLSVLREIIFSTTDEGDMVFDPFAGTGATLVAALELGRDCMGTELDDNYFLQAQARMIATVGGE